MKGPQEFQIQVGSISLKTLWPYVLAWINFPGLQEFLGKKAL